MLSVCETFRPASKDQTLHLTSDGFLTVCNKAVSRTLPYISPTWWGELDTKEQPRSWCSACGEDIESLMLQYGWDGFRPMYIPSFGKDDKDVWQLMLDTEQGVRNAGKYAGRYDLAWVECQRRALSHSRITGEDVVPLAPVAVVLAQPDVLYSL